MLQTKVRHLGIKLELIIATIVHRLFEFWNNSYCDHAMSTSMEDRTCLFYVLYRSPDLFKPTELIILCVYIRGQLPIQLILYGLVCNDRRYASRSPSKVTLAYAASFALV